MEHVGDEQARLWLKVRIGLVAAFFAIGFVAVVGRVYYLQTVEAEALTERIAAQREGEVTRQARRGDIRDRNEAELAVSVKVPSIYARPRMLGEPHEEAQRLEDVLELDRREIEEKLDTNSPFVWMERQAHPRIAEAVEELDLPGLGVMEEYDRYYPMGPLAGQLLGFVGIDGEGLEGIERQFDDQLSGDPYRMRVTRDAIGQEMMLSDIPQFGTFEGHSVHLTIDEKIQRTAHRALNKQVEKHDAKRGHALVMDVNTGEMLAMAQAPEFDPNRFQEFTSDQWRLRSVTDVFEPGSVFKPFLLAAALQEGATTLDRVYDLEGGRMRIGGYTIGDVMRREELTAAEIIQKSSNIGTYKIAQELGRETYYDYIRAFGFGSLTGIGLRGEQSGVVWPPDNWAEITFANVSFGQGLSATPLQLITGMATVANGGRLMEPMVVDEIRNRAGEVVWNQDPMMVRQVISEEVAEQTAWAMSLATLEAGTGTAGDIDHFTVAAKTGTAQQVDPETGTYGEDTWVSGYVGFVPAEAPEIAVAVFIDEPQGVRYGGRVAGPAFAEIAETALVQREVLPLPIEQRFDRGDGPPELVQSNVARPAPEGTIVLPPRRVMDGGGDAAEQGTVPNFYRLTLRQALDRARQVGIVPRVTGSGVVTDQHPAPGTPIEETARVQLTLSPPGQLEVTDEQQTDDQQE